MGCGGSKLDELQPVALCRDRAQLLADAIRHRYALAEAHRAYVGSLSSVGCSLQRFFAAAGGAGSCSPVLELPKSRKGDAFAPLSPCGSHLHFCSEDSESDDGCSLLHCDGSFDVTGEGGVNANGYFHYARKGPPASVVGFERVPFGHAEVGRAQVGSFRGDSGEPSSSFGDPHGYYDGFFQFQSDHGQDGYRRENGGYPFGQGNPYASGFGGMVNGLNGGQDSASSRPPPPPSPPMMSTWDFLNPFGTFDSYYRTYTSSRSSREVREEEGIPELEDDEHEEVVKEAYACRNFAAKGSSFDGGAPIHGTGASVEDNGRSRGMQMHSWGRSGNDGENLPVDKNVVSNGVHQGHLEKGASINVGAGTLSVPIVLEEIKAQFDKASMCCEEISKMLEVGKLPFHQGKFEVVSSRMIHAIAPSLPTAAISIPSVLRAGGFSENDVSYQPQCEEGKCMESRNLSATLQQLHIWEKKLHEEVRAEEKLRVLHDKKCKQLKHLDHTGAEAQKLDTLRATIKKLSTKIKISIQVIESISKRISKLRDEELFPQLNELTQGLFKMWQITLNCHGNQFRAIVQAQTLDICATGSAENLSDSHKEATMQLAIELLNWIQSFSYWIDATKNCVRSLNCWLRKCLNYEPEVTPDGLAPFSPEKLGTPPIFALCNSWSEAMDRISEWEVVEAMQDFTTGILYVWQQHYTKRRSKFVTDKDMDPMLKALDNEDHKIHKAVDALKKRCSQLLSQNSLLLTGQIIHLSHTGEARNLHLGLRRIFEVMERFASRSVEAYLEL